MIKKPPKKVTKATLDKARRKRLEKELDKLWGQIAHAKVKSCQWPGCTNTERLHAHHYFHQSQGLHARWSLENFVILCYGHHIFQVHTKGDVEPIREVMIWTLGIGRFEELKASVRLVWKPHISELESLRDVWIAILDEKIIEECGL